MPVVLIPDAVSRFSAEDNRRDGFVYTVGICVTALRDTTDQDLQRTGAIQVHKKTPNMKTDGSTHRLGSFEQTEIMSGSELSMFNLYNILEQRSCNNSSLMLFDSVCKVDYFGQKQWLRTCFQSYNLNFH